MARRRRPGVNSASALSRLREYPSVIANRVRLELGPRTLTALAQLEGLRRQAAARVQAFEDDRRRFHPEGKFAPRIDRSGRYARVVAASLLGSAQRFVDPLAHGSLFQPGSRAWKRLAELHRPEHTPQYREKLMECIRRKMRREVLFAKGVGGSKHVRRSRRRGEWSDVHC